MEEKVTVLNYPTFTYKSTKDFLDLLLGEEKDFPLLKGFRKLPEKLEDYKKESTKILKLSRTLENIIKSEPLVEVFTVEGKNKIRITHAPTTIKKEVINFLLPVCDFYHYYNREAIEIIANIWELAIENNIFIEDGDYDTRPMGWDYFSSKTSKCPFVVFRPELKKWKEVCPGYNFSPIIDVLRKLFKYGTNYSITVELLVKKLKDLIDFIGMTKERLDTNINEINFGIEFTTTLQEKNGLKTIVEEAKCGDFSFIQDPMSRYCLLGMFEAIKDTPEAEEWFIADGNTFSRSPVLKKLSRHKAVDDCGHSGMTMSWTLTQFKWIFTKGWESWVLSMLSHNGVGWDHVSLEQAIEFGNVECTMYILNKLGCAEKQDSLNFAMEKVIEKGDYDILNAVLKDFDTHFAEEQYDEWKNFKCQNHQQKISRILDYHRENAASSTCKVQSEISGAIF